MGRYVDVRMRPVYYIICDLFWLSSCFWDGSNPRDLLLILMASFDLSKRYILLFRYGCKLLQSYGIPIHKYSLCGQ